MACCPLPTGAATCKATEVLDFTDPKAGQVGPLAIQVHNGGIPDEYKSLYVESPVVTKPGQFITTLPCARVRRDGNLTSPAERRSPLCGGVVPPRRAWRRRPSRG